MPPVRRPHVAVHVAQSLDGRIALDGGTTLLSTEEGKRQAHAARAACDAVLVGVRTVRIDDPRLTVRLAAGSDPLRVVLASELDVPTTARVLDRRGRVLIVGAEGRATDARKAALEEAGADVAIVAAGDDGLVSLDAALRLLLDRGIGRLLVEGGARVLTSFFRARLVDRVAIEIAMRLLGAPATAIIGALGVDVLDRAPSLTNVAVEQVGTNLLIRGDVQNG